MMKTFLKIVLLGLVTLTPFLTGCVMRNAGREDIITRELPGGGEHVTRTKSRDIGIVRDSRATDTNRTVPTPLPGGRPIILLPAAGYGGYGGINVSGAGRYPGLPHGQFYGQQQVRVAVPVSTQRIRVAKPVTQEKIEAASKAELCEHGKVLQDCTNPACHGFDP